MTDVTIPPAGTHPGGLIKLRDPSVLGPDEQDEYLDLAEEIREDKRKSSPPAVDPANPAVLASTPDTPVRLSRKDLFPVYALVISWVVEDSPLGPLHPWTPEKRRELGLHGWNLLKAALEPYFELLNGSGPKDQTEDTPTSAPTSSGSADAPRPEPPTAT